MKLWVVFSALWTGGVCLQCLSSDGSGVDWYSIYKAAEISKSSKFNKGLGFFYLDVNKPSWILSPSLINDTETALTKTVTQIYTGSKTSFMYILYNDEPPVATPQNIKGHTKGMLAFTKTTGFWLVHSVPKYPPHTDHDYSWNYLGSRNGQLFLCVTFSYQQLGLIAYQLFMNQPQIYDHNIPDDIGADYPLLNLIVKGKKPSGPQWYNMTELTSSQGQKFMSFAKSDDYGEDLYESLLAPNLKSSLKVETWLNGQGTKLPSNCTLPYQVINIRAVTLSEQASFNETKDHSKWAVSAASSVHFISETLRHETPSAWVCVADINRMESQFKRGGGAICFQHSQVWAAFSDVIARADSCQSHVV